MSVAVRRVRAGEGARVRDLRLRAVDDPAAPIAFLTTRDEELARDAAFWEERASGGATGDSAAMFVAEVHDEWIGTATVLVRRANEVDHTGRRSTADYAQVVGVYVDPARRGSGVIDSLLQAAAEWTSDRGFAALSLDVHADNTRAQTAYRRAGFIDTGERFTSSIGPELGMTRSLRSSAAAAHADTGSVRA